MQIFGPDFLCDRLHFILMKFKRIMDKNSEYFYFWTGAYGKLR